MNLHLRVEVHRPVLRVQELRQGHPEEAHLGETGFGIEAEISIKAVKKGLKVLEVPSYEKKRESGEGKLLTLRDGWAILRAIMRNT